MLPSTSRELGDTSAAVIDPPSPGPESANDNTALIAGAVGGAVAALLLICLVIFLVLRSRRNKAPTESTPREPDVPLGPVAVGVYGSTAVSSVTPLGYGPLSTADHYGSISTASHLSSSDYVDMRLSTPNSRYEYGGIPREPRTVDTYVNVLFASARE